MTFKSFNIRTATKPQLLKRYYVLVKRFNRAVFQLRKYGQLREVTANQLHDFENRLTREEKSKISLVEEI